MESATILKPPSHPVKWLLRKSARDFNATSLSTYDFFYSLNYLLKINLLILLKEPSIELALLTLRVMTETHVYFGKA